MPWLFCHGAGIRRNSSPRSCMFPLNSMEIVKHITSLNAFLIWSKSGFVELSTYVPTESNNALHCSIRSLSELFRKYQSTLHCPLLWLDLEAAQGENDSIFIVMCLMNRIARHSSKVDTEARGLSLVEYYFIFIIIKFDCQSSYCLSFMFEVPFWPLIIFWIYFPTALLTWLSFMFVVYVRRAYIYFWTPFPPHHSTLLPYLSFLLDVHVQQA